MSARNPDLSEGDLEILMRSGRLLIGALITYLSGNASVDSTMRRYVPEQVDPMWGQIALELASCLQLKIDPRTRIRIVPETPPKRRS